MRGIPIVPGRTSLNFYVGATLSDMNVAHNVMKMLEHNFGMNHAFRWGPVDVSEYPAQSAKEIAAVRTSDLFIGILPGRLGLQAEIGASLMRKCFEPTRIVLWAPSDAAFAGGVEGFSTYPNVFWHHPHVERAVGSNAVETLRSYFMNDRMQW